MNTHVSIRDIAARAGVHPSTVSLCLNDNPKAAQKTRDRVRRAAEELGYRPHPYLSALMRNRRQGAHPGPSPTLALITAFPTRQGWKQRFPRLAATLRHARNQAEIRGFRIVEEWCPIDRSAPSELGERLLQKGIHGAILTPLPRPEDGFDWQWERFAVVGIGTTLREPRMHLVRSNHFRTMTVAMDECRRLGYRRIGLALDREVDLRIDHRWLAAFLVKQQEFGLPNPPEPLIVDEWSETAFLRWCREQRPDVVLVDDAGPPTAWLKAAGFRIPGDIGVASLSCPAPRGPQSGVFENWELKGRRAVNILIGLLGDNELGLNESPIVSLVDGTWNPGRTVSLQKP